MRLLYFDDAGKLAIKDFSGKPIPPYVILSHRWGLDEVLYADLKDPKLSERKIGGYKKLLFCAECATRSGIKYFWVDTCCIDKWNRRELSKAINSMFAWYQNAAKCCVYLSDVSATSISAQQQSEWEASFRASKWFTRGWTLQELLAPASVEFFCSEGWRLGDKLGLTQMLNEITGIPTAALRGHPLKSFDTNERKAWAANRETSEPEDGAYCLLGLLDVEMLLTYGEGREKAMERLNDVLQSRGKSCIIPFSQNDCFVGRESELCDLEARLFSSEQTTKIVITGEGGTGKSQLALRLAYKVRTQHKGCMILWIDSGDADSLYQGFESIAKLLHIAGWDKVHTDARQLVKAHLSTKAAGQWLIIFDGADDVSQDFADSALRPPTNLVEYLPESALGSIVFTTTDDMAAGKLAAQHTIDLCHMSADTAFAMLSSYSPLQGAGYLKWEIELLLSELSYLPLAIVQAAAHITTTKLTVGSYRSALRTQARDTVDPVTLTLLISLKRLRTESTSAFDLLCLAACMDHTDIPLDIFQLPSHARDETVQILRRFALITLRPQHSALDVHRLVHAALRSWLQKQGSFYKWNSKATARLLEEFPDVHDKESTSKWRRLLPHVKQVLRADVNERKDEARRGTWNTLIQWARFIIDWLSQRMPLSKQAYDAGLKLTSRCANKLVRDGRWREAEELLLQVMTARVNTHTEEHHDILACTNELAVIYYEQGRLTEAERLLLKLGKTREKVLGKEHPDTLRCIGSLAGVYAEQGRFEEAEKLSIRVIETRKKVLGEDHEATLFIMNNLATLYNDQHRWIEAISLHLEVIEKKKRKLGEEHHDTLNSMHNLGAVYRDQGRWEEAEQIQTPILKIRKRDLGDEHPLTLTGMYNLAITFKATNRNAEAWELMSRCQTLRESKLGAAHPQTVRCNNTLSEWEQQSQPGSQS